MSEQRLTIVSADCHAGPRRMADYRPYLEERFLADFDDYCARIDKFEAEIGSGLEGGGAPSYGETGLWDSEARTAQLDGDGVAAEIIYAQGSVAFHTYPAVGGGPKVDFKATPEQIAAGCRAYNRWLADLCSKDPRRHIGIARVPLPDVDAAVAEVEWAAKNGLRGGVHLADAPGGHFAEILLSDAAETTLVLSDGRRYSRLTRDLALAARDEGIAVTLITDPYCDWAPAVVTELFAVPTDLNHFWDTTAAMSSLIGLMVNGVFRELGAGVETRMARVSELYGNFIGHTAPGRNPGRP